MPAGMERHKTNTTWYHAKQDLVYWRVEFILHENDDSKKTTLVLPKVSEQANLMDELNKLLPLQKKQHDLCKDGDLIMLLIKKLPCPSNNARYVELHTKKTLRDALHGMTVIEFPTIYVVWKQHLHLYPRSIQEL